MNELLNGLTPRQYEIATAIANGDTLEQVARRLKRSRFTVRNHLKVAFKALGVRSQRELILTIGTNFRTRNAPPDSVRHKHRCLCGRSFYSEQPCKTARYAEI